MRRAILKSVIGFVYCFPIFVSRAAYGGGDVEKSIRENITKVFEQLLRLE